MGFEFRRDGGASFHRLCRLSRSAPALAFVAAKTKTIKLMSGAVILPWNDPLRVVERASQLDHSERRPLHPRHGPRRRAPGNLRASSELADSREMFDEAALIIMEGLRTGFVEGRRQILKQPVSRFARAAQFRKDRCVMSACRPRRRRSRRNMA